MTTQATIVETLVRAVRVVAVSVWLGGLLILGTTVAPLIFRNVPAPSSADAMTLVFLRFDRFAIAAGIMLLACEIAWLVRSQPRRSVAAGRVGVVGLALAFRLIEAVWLAPGIAALHHKGATRGFGELGEALERLHRGAELTGKFEAGLLAMFVIFLALPERQSAISD